MLFRLIIFGLLVFGGITLFRMFKGGRGLPSGLTRDRLDALTAGAKSSIELKEALELRTRILETVKAQGSAFDALGEMDVPAQVDEIVSQLGRQLDAERRVIRALDEFDSEGHDKEVSSAKGELDEASDDDGRAIAQRTLDHLEKQKEQVERLGKRKEVLRSTIRQTVVELRNVHLALLDAASSSAGLGGERAKQIRDGLAQATDSLQRQQDAEDEVEQLLRGEQAKQLQAGRNM